MKTLLLMTILLVAIGCSTTRPSSPTHPVVSNEPVPLHDVFQSIATEGIYEMGFYDCSNKAGKYAEALLNANVTNFEVRVSNVIHQLAQVDPHAYFVFTIGQDKVYADPTTGRIGASLRDISDARFFYMEYDERNVPWIYSPEYMQRLIQYHEEWVPRPVRE